MKVAILIPTLNRQDWIERTVRYYDELKSPHPIYIGDASSLGGAQQTKDFLKNIKNVKVNYFNWEGLSVVKTIAQLAEKAADDCDYCAYHGDDDYFVPSSLSLCAGFLAENPSYRTAQGRAAVFSLDRPGPYGEIRSLGDYWRAVSLEQESSVERLMYFTKHYSVLQFSTHRTREFVEDCQYFREIVEGLSSEVLHCFTFAIKGKSKFLDCLYLIRNAHENIGHPDFLDMAAKEYWSSDFNKSIRGLSIALQESSDLSLKDSEKLIFESLKSYYDQGLASSYSRNNTNISGWLRKLTPEGLKIVVRSLINSISDSSDMRLLRSSRSRFHNKFVPVVRSLTQETFPQSQ